MTLRCTIQLRGWAEFMFPEQASPRGCWVCTDMKLPRPRVTFPRIVYSFDGTPTGVHWRCEAHGFVRMSSEQFQRLAGVNPMAASLWTQAASTVLEDLQEMVDRVRRDR